MTEIKEPPQGDNEKTLEKLKNENTDLRGRIKKLQKENSLLKEKLSAKEKKPSVPREEKKPSVPKEEKTSLKLFKKQKKAEVPDSSKKPKGSKVSKRRDIEVSSEFETPNSPFSSKYKIIIDGDSRRMCPSCDNTDHKFIYEETDKTNMIMDYPRIYGKKYKCGKCGQEWRVPVVLE